MTTAALGGEAEVHMLECNLEDNSAESSGGHIQVVASSLIVHDEGAELIWPKQEPIFPTPTDLVGGDATAMTKGVASGTNGGSISCVASLSDQVFVVHENEQNTCPSLFLEFYDSSSLEPKTPAPPLSAPVPLWPWHLFPW